MNTPSLRPLTSIVLAATAAITLTGCPKSEAPLPTDQKIYTAVDASTSFVSIYLSNGLPGEEFGLDHPGRVTLLDEDNDGTVDSVHSGRAILVKPGFKSRCIVTKDTRTMTPEMETTFNAFYRLHKDAAYHILTAYRDAEQAKRESDTPKR